MPTRQNAKELTHTYCKSVAAGSKIKRIGDTIVKGLYLVVEAQPSDSRYFVLRYTRREAGGKRRDSMVGLGSFPEVSIANARKAATELRAVIKAGHDPRAHRKIERAQAAKRDAETFRVIADEWLARKKPNWKTAHYDRNEGLLRRLLLPDLGDLPITAITEPILLNTLRMAYDDGIKDSAIRARIVAAQVIDYAKETHRFTGANPGRELARSSVLARPEVRHRKALRPTEVGPFLRVLRQRETAGRVNHVIAAALRLSLMVTLRDSALRGATWSEIDLDAGVWTVPATRMKSGREHRLPLPAQAVAILTELARQTKRGPESFVFASALAEAGTISENTLTVAIRACGYDATLHGTSRSTIADVLTEAGFPSDAIERQADRVMRGARAAYVRTDFFQQRKVAMAWLAVWLDAQEREAEAPPAPADNVVQFPLAAVA